MHLVSRTQLLAVVVGLALLPVQAYTLASPLSEKITLSAQTPQVEQLLSAENSSCIKSPFSQLIRSTGVMAKNKLFRFSTKFWNNEIDLGYYGYCYLLLIQETPHGQIGIRLPIPLKPAVALQWEH